MYIGKGREAMRTKDHVLPISRGGLGAHRNKVYACFRCNQEKSNMLLDEYRERVAATRGLPGNKFYGEIH